ncbi:ectin-like isoform X2 [Montipora capricornis]|uniref:ectin-like isoform X2 n=1 Tax=Montipora capricornis TaxID=246305 RepID=UPI0035F14E7F
MRSSIVYLLVASLALCHGAPNTFQTIRARAHYAFRNYPVRAQTEEKRGQVAVKINACLYAHNKDREDHDAAGLVWDAGLAEDAQEWADHLAYDVGGMVHAQNTGQGENLYWSQGSHVATCADAVKAWDAEEVDYDYNHPPHTFKDFLSAKKPYGHFTQVVWKGTTKVGVAITTKGEAPYIETFIVARYSPQGNMLGRFEENVHRPQ